MIFVVRPMLIVVERTMVGSDPHAGVQTGVAGLLAVVPKPQSKKGRGGWVKRNFDSHGRYGYLILPEELIFISEACIYIREQRAI